MTVDNLYTLANTAILVPWLLMILAPNWRWTQKLIANYTFSIIIALAYLLGMITWFGSASADFTTLEGITQLFGVKEFALIGWLHYLAFDLFVGSWEYLNAKQFGVPHWALIIALLFTLMAGPIGLLIYLGLRQVFASKKP